MRNQIKRAGTAMLAITIAAGLWGCAGAGTETTSAQGTETGTPGTTAGESRVSEEKAVTLSFGGTASAEDTITQAMQMVADLAKEKSGGSITINLFPASQLGGAAEQIEGVITGSQDMFVDAGGYLSEYVPDRMIAGYFWMFETPEHFENFTKSELSEKWNQECADKFGLRVLATNWFRQPSVIATKRPVRSIEDIKGMKIRVPQTQTSIAGMEAIGAVPTAIAYSEVYLSLSQGVIDATVGTKDAMYTMSFYTAVDNITLTNHTYDSVYCMVNDNMFQSLSENQQKALTEACQEAGVWYTETVQEMVDGFYDEISASGTQIIELSDEERQRFIDAVGEVCQQKEAEGVWSAGLYDQIKAMK